MTTVLRKVKDSIFGMKLEKYDSSFFCRLPSLPWHLFLCWSAELVYRSFPHANASGFPLNCHHPAGIFSLPPHGIFFVPDGKLNGAVCLNVDGIHGQPRILKTSYLCDLTHPPRALIWADMQVCPASLPKQWDCCCSLSCCHLFIKLCIDVSNYFFCCCDTIVL